jgi:hypothetical protein
VSSPELHDEAPESGAFLRLDLESELQDWELLLAAVRGQEVGFWETDPSYPERRL